MANNAYIHVGYGTVAGDPTTRQQGNSTITTFKMYVQTTKKSQDPKHPYASDLYTVSVWGKDGDVIMKRVQRATKVSVHGAFTVSDPWKDKNGNEHIDLRISADPLVNGGVVVLADGIPQNNYAQRNNQADFAEDSPF